MIDPLHCENEKGQCDRFKALPEEKRTQPEGGCSLWGCKDDTRTKCIPGEP